MRFVRSCQPPQRNPALTGKSCRLVLRSASEGGSGKLLCMPRSNPLRLSEASDRAERTLNYEVI